MCLKWLERNNISSDSLLDFGSGSGVLAITARKLGASFVEGIEVDPKAVDNANYNTMLNGIDVQFHKIEDMEKEPAYKRKGLDVNSDVQDSPSRLSIDKDNNDDLQIRSNNSFSQMPR